MNNRQFLPSQVKHFKGFWTRENSAAQLIARLGKTVETADAMARLCFAYQDAGYHEQVHKHLLLLKAAAEVLSK